MKSFFLNGFIKEEVFVQQSPDFGHPNHIDKLNKGSIWIEVSTWIVVWQT